MWKKNKPHYFKSFCIHLIIPIFRILRPTPIGMKLAHEKKHKHERKSRMWLPSHGSVLEEPHIPNGASGSHFPILGRTRNSIIIYYFIFY